MSDICFRLIGSTALASVLSHDSWTFALASAMPAEEMPRDGDRLAATDPPVPPPGDGDAEHGTAPAGMAEGEAYLI